MYKFRNTFYLVDNKGERGSNHIGTELGFEIERDKYNFSWAYFFYFLRNSWTYFLKSQIYIYYLIFLKNLGGGHNPPLSERGSIPEITDIKHHLEHHYY